MLFALAAIADPAFVSLVVIAGRADPSGWSSPHLTWTLVSHIPLILVLAMASMRTRAGRGSGPSLFARISPWMVLSYHGRSVSGGVSLAARCLLVLRNGEISLYRRDGLADSFH